jgi:Acetyltransferase (GNAT) domain/Acetyltransferase (GNAT) family
MSDLDIRAASAAEFSVAVDWAASEGWNPGLDDLAAFHAADPGDFFLGYLDERPVSSISVVRYGDSFGFLGFYIVHPEHRGSGAGIATWNHGMAYLAGRTVGLDGVIAQQDNYRKSGFVFAGRNVRHSGPAPAAGARESRAEIIDIGADTLPALLAYDRRFFAAPRDAFTTAWTLPTPDVRRWTRLAIAEGEIVGYGTLRACRSGYKIGPLFAEDEKTALDLFLALCEKAEAGAEISLDTPEDNPAAVALARRFDLQPAFETARMYRGTAPTLPLARTFGITTFELG